MESRARTRRDAGRVRREWTNGTFPAHGATNGSFAENERDVRSCVGWIGDGPAEFQGIPPIDTLRRRRPLWIARCTCEVQG